MLSAVRMALNYGGKRILAPMVRIGTLPSRLLALQYGADIVYSEEIIDHKLIECRRVVNPVLDTVDFNLPDGTNVFRTCAEERGRVVLQIGTADPERAVQVAQLFGDDVAGIDVNMGCPKEYSTKGGMGAALLTTPDLAENILSALVAESKVPVTAKIRILSTVDESIRFAHMVEATGVAAIAVHYRFTKERPRDAGHMDYLRAVVDAVKSVPVIANGGSLDIRSASDLDAFWAESGASSVMVARAAQWNMSVFRRDGLLPYEDVARAYLQRSLDCGNCLGNTKYCLLMLLASASDDARHALSQSANSMRELCAVWGLARECDATLATHAARAEAIGSRLNDFSVPMPIGHREIDVDSDEPPGCARDGDAATTPLSRDQGVVSTADGAADTTGESAVKRLASVAVGEDRGDTSQGPSKRRRIATEVDVRADRTAFSGDVTPKSSLLELARQRGLGQPSYDTRQSGRMFRSFVRVGGREYTAAGWRKSKRHAEQAAALACLTALDAASPFATPAADGHVAAL